MYDFPYIDFSTQTPNCSQMFVSLSAPNIHSRACLARNFACFAGVSLDIPMTTVFAASNSAPPLGAFSALQALSPAAWPASSLPVSAVPSSATLQGQSSAPCWMTAYSITIAAYRANALSANLHRPMKATALIIRNSLTSMRKIIFLPRLINPPRFQLLRGPHHGSSR